MNHRTLCAYDCSDTTSSWARKKVRIAFRGFDLLHCPSHIYLALEGAPIKVQGRPRVASQRLTFLAFIVRKPHKTSIVEALQQDDSSHRLTVENGGHGHGMRLISTRESRRKGGVEPPLKLHKRVRVDLFFDKFPDAVVLAKVS